MVVKRVMRFDRKAEKLGYLMGASKLAGKRPTRLGLRGYVP